MNREIEEIENLKENQKKISEILDIMDQPFYIFNAPLRKVVENKLNKLNNKQQNYEKNNN